eukprot:CAMPEP_0172676048 /NCGR_PEP_ID=MMETSP1074-20121228/13681_1 /TAXON_ID=2916 /ORGANISM="Ceratium fusus, Strain PA161109" /LENGTH=42 /DNA_ID= /DNA_START= /DNA_END= /DNA_ORIENTATION=
MKGWHPQQMPPRQPLQRHRPADAVEVRQAALQKQQTLDIVSS